MSATWVVGLDRAAHGACRRALRRTYHRGPRARSVLLAPAGGHAGAGERAISRWLSGRPRSTPRRSGTAISHQGAGRAARRRAVVALSGAHGGRSSARPPGRRVAVAGSAALARHGWAGAGDLALDAYTVEPGRVRLTVTADRAGLLRLAHPIYPTVSVTRNQRAGGRGRRCVFVDRAADRGRAERRTCEVTAGTSRACCGGFAWRLPG